MYIVDRRLNPGGKSLENRQRFLRRARAQMQRAVAQASRDRGIGDVLNGGEVSIALDGVEEPRLFRGSGGRRDFVLPGNKTFSEGDILPRPDGGAGGGGRSAGKGDGEDAFRFVLTREEFLDLFLEDLALPDLAKRRLTDCEQSVPVRAGYSVSGSPSNIAINRTMRLAMMRRVALNRPGTEELKHLDDEIRQAGDEKTRHGLEAERSRLQTRMKRIPYIDPIDIRFRRYEAEPKPIAQAVMFCLMDVSGSMTEHMKDLAKRFYTLLYIFLTRQYKKVEIVFIRHTEHAEEVDEATFFGSPATGGTQVSSALDLMKRIVAERFPVAEWNIYAAQASDGDNAYSDSGATGALMRDAILPVCQYFAYLEVGASNSRLVSSSSVWALYERFLTDFPVLAMRKVSERNEIFPVFHDLFQRRPAQGKAVG